MKNVTMPKLFQPFYCDDMIRLGKLNDGGYLVNKLDVLKSSKLLSFGIGEDTSFERDFLNLNNVDIAAYDSTIDKLENFNHIKENVTKHNINDILKSESNCFLKCDIDGGEYEILYDLIRNSHRFTGVSIEFHNISNYQFFNELANFVGKLELRLIHVHINNYSYLISSHNYIPDVIELTFSSSKENTRLDEKIILPHVLDTPNNPNDDEFIINF